MHLTRDLAANCPSSVTVVLKCTDSAVSAQGIKCENPH